MDNVNIYHERQIRELCALHALNNLFQAKGSFTKSQLDEICKRLSPNEWINPHRSVLGIGNYDINVIMTALESKGCETVWFDKRKDPSCIKSHDIVGFILNVPTEYKLGFVTLPVKRRHWISVRKISGKNWWNLDSKLSSPQLIGDDTKLLDYLRSQLQSNDKELFLVMKKGTVEKSPSWVSSSNET